MTQGFISDACVCIAVVVMLSNIAPFEPMYLQSTSFTASTFEAGLDEAGRGCLAGPVVAAAVIWPENFGISALKDSKLLSAKERVRFEPIIKEQSIAWAIGTASVEEIDAYNIAHASYIAMHRAIESLQLIPDMLIVDGNRFLPYKDIPHVCLVKADNRLTSVAAASVLAKTHRDRLMDELHRTVPQFHWNDNKGYPSAQHRKALLKHGPSIHHRKTFHPVKQALAQYSAITKPPD